MKTCYGRIIMTLIVALVLASAVPAHADTPVHSQLVHSYAEISQDFANHDLAGIASLTAPGFIATAPGQPVVTRDSMLADIKVQMSMLQNATWKRYITKLAVGKGRAAALVYGHLTATIYDHAHKSHAFVLNALAVDQWIRVNGKWEIMRSQVLKVQALEDGKPIQRQ